jgi:REJ domain
VGQPKVKFIVYFNGQLAEENVKIPSKESEQKISIDATHTKFSSGYTIKKTEWDFANGKTDMNDGAPLMESQEYKEGEYIVKLKLTRNDDEVFTQNIILKVGDPIASIFASKLQPDKGEKVTFQAKKVSQDGVSYAWEIRKIGSNSLLATGTGPRMEYAFLDVGRYSVDLISSKRELRDRESIEILVDSQTPVVRFDAEVESSETPNIYLLDGTSSYDPDYPDDQTMKYEWFINDKPAQLSDTNSSNSRGSYIFPEKGTYQVELHVTDTEGKQGVFKKTITIKSLLSIQLNIRPQVVKRGERVLLSATAPNAETYEWNITGKDPVIKETGKLIVSFDTSGTYPMTVKVTDTDGQTNMIKRKIYVVNGEEPFAIINMTSKSLLAGYEKNACEGQEALIADRVSPVAFVGDKSVNAGGKTSDLTYFWKIGLNKTAAQKNLSHTFDELGCEKISLTVTDKKTGVSHTSEEWVRIVNVPPKFSDIDVAVENIDQDPMKVNLRMQGAKDPDGVIRSYTWYYATNPDGDEPL